MTDNRLALVLLDERKKQLAKEREKEALGAIEGGGGAPTPLPTRPGLYQLAEMATAGYPSEHTRRMYRGRVLEYLGSREVEEWGITRESVHRYMVRMGEEGKGHSVIEQIKAAVRVFVEELEARGLIGAQEAQAIKLIRVRGRRNGVGGRRYGQWLGKAEVGKLIEGKLIETAREVGQEGQGVLEPKCQEWVERMEHMRDGALLVLLLGCGLRRSEAVRVKWGQYRRVEGRMCLVDVVGKGQKVCTLPVPGWGVTLLDRWELASRKVLGVETGTGKAGEGDGGPVLRKISPIRGGRPTKKGPGAGGADGKGGAGGEGLSSEWVRLRVKEMTGGMGDKGEGVNPHDLRRTLAQHLRAAGVELEQVKEMLRHASVKTTEVYLGGKLELGKGKAGVDKLWGG